MVRSTLPEPWKTLADRLGGVAPLAEALGASLTTLHRWAHLKQVPTRTAKKAILAAFDQAGITPPPLDPPGQP